MRRQSLLIQVGVGAVLMAGLGVLINNLTVNLIRTAAGLAYLVSLIALATFVVLVRVMGWPARQGAFNVWVNLPLFDPTAGGDVLYRLQRDARINIALGFLLPFSC